MNKNQLENARPERVSEIEERGEIKNNALTPSLIRELRETTQRDPVLIKWHDGECDVQPGAAFHHGNPLAFADHDVPHEILANRDDLFQILLKPIHEFTDDDDRRAAEILTK